MKINTELSHDAEYIGDIQENRVGIDKENIDFISTLLTSNLYSNPLEAFFRETVSNAYDSHVEAGTDEPILILIEELPTDSIWSSIKLRISIRDYGTGLSPERFDSIYKNIGSSTKRESNDYIGMLGLGRFSCLSCVDVANITSYHNGIKYSYVMYKNSGGINIDKISETKGEFKNGLEVSIDKLFERPYIADIRSALSTICMFDKVYVKHKGNNSSIGQEVLSFNERQVAKYTTFSICSYLRSTENWLKMGNVLYPFPSDSNNIDSTLKTKGLLVELPVGSVDIVPNRENLQYTVRTKAKVTESIAAVKKELQDLINKEVKKDFTLAEFCNFFSSYSSFFDLPVVYSPTIVNISIPKNSVKIDFKDTTIKGLKVPENFDAFLSCIRNLEIDKNIVYKKLANTRNKIILKRILSGGVDIFEKGSKTITSVTSEYIKSIIKKDTIILNYQGKELYAEQLRICAKTGLYNSDECVEFLINQLEIKKILNSDVPTAFIECYKEKRRENKISKINKEITIRKYHDFGSYSSISLRDLGKPEGLILYAANTFDDEVVKRLAKISSDIRGISAVITVKAKEIYMFRNKRQYMLIDDFLFIKNSILSKLVTGKIIYDNMANALYKGMADISCTPLYIEFRKKYRRYLGCIKNWTCGDTLLKDIYKYYIEKNWINNSDIEYFSLKDRDIEAYKGWANLKARYKEIIQNMACKKFGMAPKIGLVMHTYSTKSE